MLIDSSRARGGTALPDFTYSCQASAEHFQQCAEFLLLRNRGLGPLAVTVLPLVTFALLSGLNNPACFGSAGMFIDAAALIETATSADRPQSGRTALVLGCGGPERAPAARCKSTVKPSHDLRKVSKPSRCFVSVWRTERALP